MKKQLLPILVVNLLLILPGSPAAQDSCYLEIHGNQHTDTDYLKRFIHAVPANTLDSALLLNDLRRLRSLASVMNVNCYEVATDSGTLYQFHIDERYTLFPVGDFGVSEDGYWIGGGLMHSNLFGRGLYAYGYYQYNERHTAHLILRNPYVLGSQWGIEIQFLNKPAIENFQNAYWMLNERQKVHLALRYEFRYEHDLSLGLGIHQQKAGLHERITSGISQDEWHELAAERNTLEVFLLEDIRKINNQHFYIGGWRNRLYVAWQHPFEGGQRNSFTVINELSYYKRLGARGNFATRWNLGYANEKEYMFQPFLADNYYSIRGIGYRAFRANTMLITNLEYRYTLFDFNWLAIQTVIFNDLAWFPENGSQIIGYYDSFQSYGGPGMRFIYKKAYNAILSVDYGFNIRGLPSGAWVIGWGQYF